MKRRPRFLWHILYFALLISLLEIGPFPEVVQAEECQAPPLVPCPHPVVMPMPIQQMPTIQPASLSLLLQQQAPTATPTLTQEEQLQQLEQQLDDAWNNQNWPLVIQIIDQIIAIDPNYDDIQTRKYYAHVNYGYQLMTEHQCDSAQAQFEAALAIRPGGEEALVGLNLLATYCPTPTPTSYTTPALTVTPTITPITPGAPTATPVVTQPISSPITYTVQPGDTLYSLAKRFGTTVQAIMQANGMMNYFIRAGEVIIIPPAEAPPGPIVHIVQPGETLYSIARLYNTTVWAIMLTNGLKSYTIWAYQALFIPSVLQPGPIIHIVQPGETLYSIAQQYNTTVPLIMLANNLRTYAIYVYQRLIIPPEGWTGWPPISVWTAEGTASGTIYIVQPGDTLFGIAQRFGTTVAQLKAVNGLTSSTIYVGMKLRIP